MASKIEFVRYAAEQCRNAGEITYKKMFGDYGLYCNGKIFALVCDDEFFLKITQSVKLSHPELPEKPPYDGAKNYFVIEDIDNSEQLGELVCETVKQLPEPKPRKPKKS